MTVPIGSEYRTSLFGGTDTTTSISSQYQFQINGLVMGTGTSFLIQAPTGLFGTTSRGTDLARPNSIGGFTQPDYPASRTISITATISSTAALLQTRLDEWQNAWTPSGDGDDPLIFRLPDSRIGGGYQTYRVYGRARRSQIDTRLWSKGVATAQVDFYCADPRMYANAISAPSASTLPSSHGGVTFNAASAGTGPKFSVSPWFTFGVAATSGSVTAVTLGTTSASWYAKIVGPVTNPRLSLGSRSILINGIVPAGSYLVVDSMSRGVWYNGDTTQTFYQNVSPYSDWWELSPSASNTVILYDNGDRWANSSPVSGQLFVEYRSAWL